MAKIPTKIISHQLALTLIWFSMLISHYNFFEESSPGRLLQPIHHRIIALHPIHLFVDHESQSTCIWSRKLSMHAIYLLSSSCTYIYYQFGPPEITPADITLTDNIGSGQFGTVYRGMIPFN
jgi:hypothetical protein